MSHLLEQTLISVIPFNLGFGRKYLQSAALVQFDATSTPIQAILLCLPLNVTVPSASTAKLNFL